MVCLLLAAAVLAVFWQVRGFEYNGYDDQAYVSQNPTVSKGLSWRNVWWAFTTGYIGLWHPLTWVSHMVDVELFGMRPGAHHLVNVFIHLANSILLFFALQYVTRGSAGGWQKSAFVAGLFALHPTRVESVAWLAERKDVLSAFFWILAVWAYGWYAAQPNLRRYLTALFLFACGLLSKPMVVTLPCVLLLLDYWPFGRLRFGQDWWRPKAPGESWWAWPRAAITPGRAVLEKLPFFVGVLISCAVTLYGFSHSNALVSDERFSWGLRLANTPISHVRYLGKLFWPADLAVLYPMPTHWAAWKVVAAAALLLALTAAFIALIRRAPYFMVGWLWFLGVLVPMIGLVSMGLQSIADRYTYVPFIGLFVMIAWGAERLRFPGKSVVAVAILGVCAVVSWRQTQHWRDTETLFTQCVKVTTNNPEAHYNLALACYLKGDRTNALQHFQEAVRIRPTYEDALNNLALVCLETGDAAQATNHLGRLLRLSPRNQFALLTMARALVVLGDYRQAKGYAELLQSPEAHVELARTLQKSGLTNEARIHLREAERLKTERR